MCPLDRRWLRQASARKWDGLVELCCLCAATLVDKFEASRPPLPRPTCRSRCTCADGMPAQLVPLQPLLLAAGKKREREASDGYLPEELDAWEAFVGSGKGQARLCRCVWGASKQGLRRSEQLSAALNTAGQVLSWLLVPPHADLFGSPVASQCPLQPFCHSSLLLPPPALAAGSLPHCALFRCAPSSWILPSTTSSRPTCRTACPRSRQPRRRAPSPASLAAGARAELAGQLAWRAMHGASQPHGLARSGQAN